MHGNQWVLKIAVLKYYSVSKRGTTAKSNPKQATDPISLHTKFGDNSSNTFPLNERKPCVTPDIGRRTPDIGHRTTDIGHRTAKKAKIIYPPPRGVDIIRLEKLWYGQNFIRMPGYKPWRRIWQNILTLLIPTKNLTIKQSCFIHYTLLGSLLEQPTCIQGALYHGSRPFRFAHTAKSC